MRRSFFFLAVCMSLTGAHAIAQPAPSTAAAQSLTVNPVRVEHAGGVRTLTLPRRLKVNGAKGCDGAQVLKLSAADAKTRPAEPDLVAQALRTGKALKLANAQCNADGSMSGTALSLEPEASSVDPCSMPSFGGSNPNCAK